MGARALMVARASTVARVLMVARALVVMVGRALVVMVGKASEVTEARALDLTARAATTAKGARDGVKAKALIALATGRGLAKRVWQKETFDQASWMSFLRKRN